MISWKRVGELFPESTLMVVAGSLAAFAGTAGCGSARSVPAMRYYANLIPGEHEQWFQDSIPYQSYPELIGIPDLNIDRRSALPAILDSLGLEDVTSRYLPEANRGFRHILRRKDGKEFSRMNDSTLRALRGRGIGAGPIVQMSDESMAALSNIIYLKPASRTSRKELRAFVQDVGASEFRRISGAQDIHCMVLDPGTGEGINDIARRLLAEGLVIYAYPSIFSSMPDPLGDE